MPSICGASLACQPEDAAMMSEMGLAVDPGTVIGVLFAVLALLAVYFYLLVRAPVR